jgi:sugar transferase (PEP-CTERM/EpsH1 system associated)
MSEILCLAHRMPFPPDRGDKIRSHHVLQRLAELAPVHVATFADDEGDSRHEGALAAVSASYRLVRRDAPLGRAGLAALVSGRPVSLTAFRHRALTRFVAETLRSRPISAIYVFSGQMGQYVPAGFAGRVVIDFVDVDSAKFAAYAAAGHGPMRWVHAREARLLALEEARLAARADASLLISAEEAALFRVRLGLAAGGAGRVQVLGNGIDAGWFDPATVEPEPQLAALGGSKLIFTGQMDYPPNVAAVVRAATRIMPLVRERFPDAGLHIIGRNPSAAVLALDGVNGCRVWGRVDDVRPWLAGADLALVPLEIARGVQNKVLEAMAMALPVIASPGAATGIAAAPGRDFAVAETDVQLAGATIALLESRGTAQAMGGAARAFVIEQMGWSAVLAPLPELMGMNADAKGARDAA